MLILKVCGTVQEVRAQLATITVAQFEQAKARALQARGVNHGSYNAASN